MYMYMQLSEIYKLQNSKYDSTYIIKTHTERSTIFLWK